MLPTSRGLRGNHNKDRMVTLKKYENIVPFYP